ncbi:uncharacterized protein LOC141655861 [Silene latifolia]|uniref:uncharacterized protein LOC141655861 n=1 Tax=Silene latifolia TaxID=37657 RepID=UPI003D772A85
MADVRSFLGLAGYYRRSVKDFFEVARPLTALMRKENRLERSKKITRWCTAVADGGASRFTVGEDDGLKFDGRWCVLVDEEMKRNILTEAHSTPYSVHPGGDKLYKDLKKSFQWPWMKKEVAEFVLRCLTCQRVKGEHKRPQGKVQSLDVPEWKWESIFMDFIIGLPRTQKGNNMIWVIVDRLTKTAHFIPMKDTWSKAELAKAYVRNIVKLHGTPKILVLIVTRGLFLSSGKSCKSVWYVSDPTNVLAAEIVEMDENLSYVEVAKDILDKKVRKTRNGEIALVKVLWANHNVEEATWEAEAEIKEKYPHLFA